MKLRIHYTTQLKAELGTDSEEIEAPDGSRFADVLRILAKKHMATFRLLVIDANGQLLPSILLCVDDEQISPDDNPVLSSGDSVTFLSAISGG